MQNIPFGILGPDPFILQGTDEWYDDHKGKWVQVAKNEVGKWSDTCFAEHVSLRGYLWRLSDAVHACRFEAKYGRPKPPRMYQ